MCIFLPDLGWFLIQKHMPYIQIQVVAFIHIKPFIISLKAKQVPYSKSILQSQQHTIEQRN